MVPFCPFYSGVSFLKPNSRKKGTLIIKDPLRSLGICFGILFFLCATVSALQFPGFRLRDLRGFLASTS